MPVDLAERARTAATDASIDCVVCDRRRVVDGPRQGARVEPRSADRRRADHVRRQRADDHLRPHRRSPQGDRQERRSCNRRRWSTTPSSPSVCRRTSPVHRRSTRWPTRSRRCTRPGTTRSPRRWHSKVCAPSTTRCRLSWRRRAIVDARGTLLYGAYLSGVALGSNVGGVAPQAVSRVGWPVQPRARRRPLGDPAARDRVQRSGVAARRWRRLAAALGDPDGDPAGALWDLAVASNVPTRLADLQRRRRPAEA